MASRTEPQATGAPGNTTRVPSARKSWLSDFKFRNGRFEVLKTGATARLDLSVLWEVAVWLMFFGCLQLRVGWLMLRPREVATIGFTPDQPRPWYLVRSAASWSGMRVVPPAEADVIMFFEDATWSDPLSKSTTQQSLNFACHDISKSRVASVFESVFGYPLAINPVIHQGLAVEKSEINSMHDGRVVKCPCERRDGKVYQRLIDTFDGTHLTDMRTPCIGGTPILVWEKCRSARDIFSVHNRRVTLRRPNQVYSPEEIVAIERFCAAFELDWGGLDILRDRDNGRIYIVDVNKTDVGPVIALRLWHKIVSISRLGRALAALAGKAPA